MTNISRWMPSASVTAEIASISLHGDDFQHGYFTLMTRAGHLDEVGGGEAEERVGRSAGRPDRVVLEQILVDEGLHGLGVTDGRDPADGESAVLAHEGGGRLLERLLEEHADAPLVDAVGPARDDEHGPAARRRLEHGGLAICPRRRPPCARPPPRSALAVPSPRRAQSTQISWTLCAADDSP
jgi:hypothetical protein